MSIDDAKKIFEKKLYIDNIEISSLSPYLNRTLENINDTIDDMLNHFSRKKLFNSKSSVIVYQKIIDDFEKLYNKNTDWQDLIFDVQAFHWLRFSQGGSTVKKNYLLSVASPFISRIDKDLEKLQEIKTDIPYMISVEEDN